MRIKLTSLPFVWTSNRRFWKILESRCHPMRTSEPAGSCSKSIGRDSSRVEGHFGAYSVRIFPATQQPSPCELEITESSVWPIRGHWIFALILLILKNLLFSH